MPNAAKASRKGSKGGPSPSRAGGGRGGNRGNGNGSGSGSNDGRGVGSSPIVWGGVLACLVGAPVRRDKAQDAPGTVVPPPPPFRSLPPFDPSVHVRSGYESDPS